MAAKESTSAIFVIVDSNGVIGAVDLNTVGNEAKTIGDVIDRINAITTANVEARINDTGDGILLVDNANGSGKLEVKEVGTTAAADLRLSAPASNELAAITGDRRHIAARST